MQIVVRADGGSEIGYGHLVRTGALVEKAHEEGHEVTVATTTPRAAREVFPAGITVVELSTRGDAGLFVDWLENASVDVVFTDAYPVDTAYQRSVRKCVPLAVLQDDARHPVCADLFVNGNLYAGDLEYEFVGARPEACLGTEYLLLRTEIREQIGDEPPWRDVPERALVTMGGSDPTNRTPAVVRAFDGIDISVDAIVGPGFDDEQEAAVRAAASSVTADVRVARDPADLVQRMFEADLAVSTASTTTYELLGLGTPLVSVPVVDNQEPIATALGERDAATVLERNAGEDAFRQAIEAYVTDPTLRRDRRTTGRTTIDGMGTARVYTKLLSLTGDR